MDVSGNKSFCESLQAVDKKAVKKEVDHFLKSMDYTTERDQNFDRIVDWLKQKTCIQEAKKLDDIIITNPPIIQFELVLTTADSDSLILKITFNGTYKFYDLKTNN